VNPWSGAEAESELADRELFERRAQALGRESVPPLAAVLRAADAVPAAPAGNGAKARAFVAMTLAAACMAAAVTRLPSRDGRPMISAEIDAGARAMTSYETASSETCSMDDEMLVSEETACIDPAPRLFSAAPKSVGIAPCVPNESCAIATE